MIPTLLPIYTFAKRMGLHPLQVMGVDAPIGSAQSRVEIHPLFQYSWQSNDAVSREELAQAIFEAEHELAEYMGFWAAPTWTVDERVELDWMRRPGSWPATLYDINLDAMSAKTHYGQVISGGRRVKSLIAAAQAVNYTDTDGDTYFETATIGPVNLPAGVTDPEEIAVYYPGLSGDDEWEVRPITATVTAGVPNTVTIVCRREQLVLKSLLEALDAQAVNGLSNGNFLTTVDVYRKYNDPSVQAQLVWRSGCAYCNVSGDSDCENCSLTIQNGCITVKNKELGIVTTSPGTWDADTETFSTDLPDVYRRPDYVRLWYRSGYRDSGLATPNLEMSRDFQLAVCKLALGKLDREIPSSQALMEIQRAWNTNLRRTRSTREGSTNYKVTNYELENCPFGTTVGAIDAWRFARSKGVLV